MPKRAAGLQTVATFSCDLHEARCVDAQAVYWKTDHERFAAASLAGERLWEVEVADGAKLVGVFDGMPVVLRSPLDPPFVQELVFLDLASGAVVRRVPAPANTCEVAYGEGTFAFLVASERFGPATSLVLVDAATERKTTPIKRQQVGDLRAIAGGFLCLVDWVFVALGREGKLKWKTDQLVVVTGHAMLAVGTGGKLARLDPSSGEPMWSFTMKGARKDHLICVGANAEVVAVLEPTLGELALLELATGAQRWRTKRVVSQQAPPLLTADAVVALSTGTAGGDFPALAVFDLADGTRRAELPTNDGLELRDGLVAGEVCVLAQVGGTALQLVRVPQAGGGGEAKVVAGVKTTAKKTAAAKVSAAKKAAGSAAKVGAAKKAASKVAVGKKTAAKAVASRIAARKKTAAKAVASPAKVGAAKKTAAKRGS
ncbi:outer membrane protein assembly factor BamB family protein [Nannocystis radixulma]|uniref:PQQ-binding-like beta-propeller repeat protein n=1 Tax=Nannocystis radixulma TaxID=2995305 RepID=A0ABT5BKB9_9BACT|nr:PQQ-binding-like beta-propeller repeat protein [Nannocystis radixulma]MDC0674596.1 PQQ-binding-like beta-propeller repeat protein [Nannocystis radixulma]